MSVSRLRRAALWYVEHGFAVFPLTPKGKTPLTAHGFKDASADDAQIAQWWTANPDANVGLVTGATNHLFVLDIDFRDGNAVQSRDDLIEQYGPIPDTCEVETGSGRHVFFAFDGTRLPRQLAPGIDLKGNGGYVVAPPSIHPSGKVYTFDGLNGQDALLQLAPPPDWLLNAIAEANGARSRGNGVSVDSAAWPKGQRNDLLIALAGRLRRAGLSQGAIEAALLQENAARCRPALPDDEVRRVAASISRYPAGPDAQTQRAPISAAVNLDAVEPSIDTLNALAIFGRRIRFVSVKRRGAMIIATTDTGAAVVWPTSADLATFARSQALIADATSILLPTPPHRQIRAQWEAAAHLLLRLSTQDEIALEGSLQEEIRDLLRVVWRAAGQPCATTSADFIDLVRATLRARRDPRGPIPPCVFCAEEVVWVHVPSLRSWASIPAITNKLYPLADVRNGLLLLGFTYHENLTRGADGDSETACLWRGPLDVLEG